MNTLQHNTKTHDKLYKKYNLKHSEIYNEFEQARLSQAIKRIKSFFTGGEPNVLDVGAGTGNLSLKFLEEGCAVTASDVSIKSLDLLKKLSGNNEKLSLRLITDKDLPFEDESFDVTATYSVLHHIPDYMNTIKEMIRVTKKRGFIFIDHEANQYKWKPEEKLSEYNALTKQTGLGHLVKLIKTRELFTLTFLKGAYIKLFLNKRYQREGDIHVWSDDHIEWDEIKACMEKDGCTILEEADYLMYKPKGGVDLFAQYKNICSDTKYILFQKNK